MPSRVRALATLALLTGLWVGGLSSGALAASPSPTPSAQPSQPTASEEPSPTEEPTPVPSCVVNGLPSVVCASETPSPSPRPTVKPSKSAEPSPTRSRRPRTSAPRATATQDETEEPSGPVVTSTFGVGSLGTPTATPDTEKASASAGDKLDQVFGVVLLSAVALGFAGITGLYVTRHRPLH